MEYPHTAAMVMRYYVQPAYRFGDEFNFGRDVIRHVLDASRSRPVAAHQPSEVMPAPSQTENA